MRVKHSWIKLCPTCVCLVSNRCQSVCALPTWDEIDPPECIKHLQARVQPDWCQVMEKDSYRNHQPYFILNWTNFKTITYKDARM
jgi:hypothetical protein